MFNQSAYYTHYGVFHNVDERDDVRTPTQVLQYLNLTLDLLFLHRLKIKGADSQRSEPESLS